MRSLYLFNLFFVLISSLSFSQTTISSGRISVSIDNLGSGIAISSIKDNGTEVLNTTTNPDLFTLFIHNSASNTDESITATTGWGGIQIASNQNSTDITLFQPANTNLSASLTAIIHIETTQGKSMWDLSVTGLGNDASLMDVIFPQLNIAAPGNDTFLYPLYSGRLTPNPGSGIDYYNDAADATDNNVGIYPRGWGTTMQFFSYYNNNYGLYFGFHDPNASLKEFGVKNENGGIKIQCKSPIPDKTVNGNDWDFPGHFELDIFNGNWYEAAMIYKKWVASQAHYWAQDTPQRNIRQHKVGDIGVWLTTSDFTAYSMNQMENTIQSSVDFYDVPVGISLYEWNYFEMDHYFPVFFPERTGLPDLINNLQTNNDLIAMPYTNGRLWDTGVGGNDSNDANAAAYYNSDGIASATKRANGTEYTQTFQSNVFAVMCPTQTNWQDVITDAADQITHRIQAGAVYIDMVAASGPAQCMDATHNHPLGGGHYWRDGYRQMFEDIHNTIPQEAFITVEGGNDFLADQVDAYMVQGWQTDHQVPAWQAIYTGKVQLFGTATGGSHYPYQKFYGRLGQGFIYGVQTGRQYLGLSINPSSDPDKLMAANYVKSLSRMRYKLRNFMSYGEMKKPLEVEAVPSGTQIPAITYDVYDWGGHHGLASVTYPAIQTSTWQNDDEVVVVFINARIQTPAGTAGGNIDFKFHINASDYGFTGDVQVQKLTPTTNGNMTTESNSFDKNVSLGNLDIVAYKITGSLQGIDTDELHQISLYPNPAQTFFNISADDNVDRLKIYNSLGQLVQNETNIKRNHVNVSQLTKGLYFVSFSYKGRQIKEKLIIN